MKLTIQLFGIAILSSVLISCETEEPGSVNPDPSVQFEISNPGEGSMYHLGDTVHIHGHISYSPGLHGYALSIINTSADSTVFYKDRHSHGSEIHFTDYWVNDVSGHSDMMLVVEAAVTHEGEIESDTIQFHCHPM